MRRMISEEKQRLLNNQVIDENGVIVDENDREFNGNVKFTGAVEGAGLPNFKLTVNNQSVEVPVPLYYYTSDFVYHFELIGGGQEVEVDALVFSIENTGLNPISLDGYGISFASGKSIQGNGFSVDTYNLLLGDTTIVMG